MTEYARVMAFKSRGSSWDDDGDSWRLSNAMETIQRAGGKIIDVDFRHGVGGNYEVLIYLIRYDAPQYVALRA